MEQDMHKDPIVRVIGEEVTVHDDDDVRTVFERYTGITEGDSIEEFDVETIDFELDYDKGREQHVLRAHVYLDPITPDGMAAHVNDDDLVVEGWQRVSYMSGNGTFGVVYELDSWLFLD